jgi:hypothetical protein
MLVLPNNHTEPCIVALVRVRFNLVAAAIAWDPIWIFLALQLRQRLTELYTVTMLTEETVRCLKTARSAEKLLRKWAVVV